MLHKVYYQIVLVSYMKTSGTVVIVKKSTMPCV